MTGPPGRMFLVTRARRWRRASVLLAGAAWAAQAAFLAVVSATGWHHAAWWVPPAMVAAALGAGYLLRWAQELRRRGCRLGAV